MLSLLFALSCEGVPNTSVASPDKPAVKIGIIAPLTGEYHEKFDEVLQTLDLAKQQEDEDCIHVQFIPKDGGCDVKTSIQAASELIRDDHVEAIVGGFCSVETLVAATVTNDDKVILISPVSSSDSISGSGEYVYRTSPPLNVLASVFPVDIAKHVIAQDPYFLLFDTTFDSLASLSRKPIVIYSRDIEFLEKNLISLESVYASTPFLLDAPVYSKDFLDVVARHKKFLDGAFVATSSPDPYNPRSNDFVAKYTATYHVVPRNLEIDLRTYDAFDLLFKSFCSAKRSGTTPKEYLDHLGAFQGVGGTFRFDQNGDPHYEKTSFKIKDGAVVPYTEN